VTTEDTRSIRLTEEELRTVMTEAVDTALVRLGVDVENPIQMQQDFQHLREWREATSSMKRKGLVVITGTLVAGGLAAAFVGIKSLLTLP